MYRFKAIIFDVDGTLADTERDGHRRAFNAAFAEAGLPWHWDVARYGALLAVTGGKERIRHYMQEEGVVLDPSRDGDAFVAALHQAKTMHYVSLLGSGAIALRPGVLRLLREAHEAGIRLAIATTTTPENVTTLLDHCGTSGLRDWFAVIAAGDVVPRKKPDPGIFNLALAQLGLAPQDVVVVEDSDNGARSALAAGIKALLITVNDYTKGQDFGAAPLVVDGLGGPGESAVVSRCAPSVTACLSGALDHGVDLRVLDCLYAGVYPPDANDQRARPLP